MKILLRACVLLSFISLLSGCNPARDSRNFYRDMLVLRSVSDRECVSRKDIGRIHLGCHFSDENYAILKGDFDYLRRMELRGPAAEKLQQMLGLQTLTGESLLDWFEDKIQFLLDETFGYLDASVRGVNLSSSFLNVYRNPFSIFEIPGHGLVEINSQKVGVAQLGAPFFKIFVGQEKSDTIKQIATLFHEARHSQGRGASFGFQHIPCPEGHRDVGKFYCDPCNNGAYTIQKLFFDSALAGCDECSDMEKIELSFNSYISKESVLSDTIECDATLEIP